MNKITLKLDSTSPVLPIDPFTHRKFTTEECDGYWMHTGTFETRMTASDFIGLVLALTEHVRPDQKARRIMSWTTAKGTRSLRVDAFVRTVRIYDEAYRQGKLRRNNVVDYFILKKD